MKLQNSKIVLYQLDEKLQKAHVLKDTMPAEGWIAAVRKTLNMSLRQMANKMSISLQSVKAMETREAQGTLTLKTLKDAAEALDMTFVYGFIPKDGSLEKMIERKAREMAENIVRRTSTTMKLEGQENSPARIDQSIEELTEEIKREMPKSLWD
jgi:predicted DNA-binding mobile mystery protein A